jgi:SAM-dependent methyltransferase
MAKKRKPYEGHEVEYQRMRAKGIRSWGERKSLLRARPREIDGDTERFLRDALAQPWAPKKGRALELGCGTGPILRWFRKRGFQGIGVDVSPTAIRMAREQSKGLRLQFRCEDVCASDFVRKPSSFDVCVDGHCLHCVTEPKDREALLKNVRRLLKPGGMFIVLTMCLPVNRPAFRRLIPGQRLVDRRIYVPMKTPRGFSSLRKMNGKIYLPTRFVAPWKTILTEVREAGFEVRMFRFNRCYSEEPLSHIAAAAVRLE